MGNCMSGSGSTSQYLSGESNPHYNPGGSKYVGYVGPKAETRSERIDQYFQGESHPSFNPGGSKYVGHVGPPAKTRSGRFEQYFFGESHPHDIGGSSNVGHAPPGVKPARAPQA